MRAVDALPQAGLLQEMAATCRILDEIGEDVAFIAAPPTNDEITELHQRYLLRFWADEFSDTDNILERQQNQMLPVAARFCAYVQRVLNPADNPSLISDFIQAVSRTDTGYVHAYVPQVLDLYGVGPPRFQLVGMQGSPRMNAHVHDAWIYRHHRRNNGCKGVWGSIALQISRRVSRQVPGAVRRKI